MLINAITETCVLLLIQKGSLLLIYFIRLKLEIMTSICSISRQFGALTATQHIQETFVFTLITGKTTVGNLISMTTIKSSAQIGRWKHLSKIMQLTVAKMNIDAAIHMVGRNRNIILSTTKCMHASSLILAQKLTVHIIIQNKIEDNLCLLSLELFLETEEVHQHLP